ncbi:MAG: CPBP family intramembrane glutamic endopeptidase [Chthoniobacterales bacterium]
MNSSKLAGGFADAPPAPLASSRHLRRFLYISIGIAVAMFLQARNPSPAPAASKLPFYIMMIALEVFFVWFVAMGAKAQGHGLGEIVRLRWRNLVDAGTDILVAAGTVAFLKFSKPIFFYFLGRWTSNTGFLLPTSFSESVAWVAVSVAAGFCEEAVYRGYLQRQLWSVTRSLPLALILQALIFACGHIYQGWRPALVTAIYGLIFGLVAAWRRSIIPGAIAHAIVDILGGFRL